MTVLTEEWNISEVLGRFRNASNATMLATTEAGHLVVYKPERGQRPLHDFDCRTLPAREVLTFEISEAAGLDSVPETRRVEGPFGPGSAQRFVEMDEEFDPAPLINHADARLWPIATLDLMINNADRKAGHVIAEGPGKMEGSGKMEEYGKIWCIDHGLTLHTEPKLRTVMWAFSGLPLPDAMVDALRRLEKELNGRLHARTAELLTEMEADALADRVGDLLSRPVHPLPPTDRPPLPWPVW